MNFKNILSRQISEYNHIYKQINRSNPSKSIEDKQNETFIAMLSNRNINEEKLLQIQEDPLYDSCAFQYKIEVNLVMEEIRKGITRYYVRDDDLFDFFKATQLKKKEVLALLDIQNGWSCGIMGHNFSCTIHVTKIRNMHLFTILTDDMNYTFCAEALNINKSQHPWVFNLAMNFLFYINAFPECVLDGVPQGIKRDPNSKVISISDKIVSHTTSEHGFVRPHFRSGYFRHFTSDYFVNCKGQVRFISSTMVKGKAKTVISKEDK